MNTSGGTSVLEEMTRTDVLAYLETRHATRLQAERDILAAAHHWAVLHHPDRYQNLSPRARDRAVPAGAAGTPPVTEYAASAFGARIQTSPYGAKRLIADAVDIHHRLPRLAEGLAAGTTRAGHARHVAEATRELSAEEAAWVDAEVVESADGRLAWKRFEALVEGKVAPVIDPAHHAPVDAYEIPAGMREAVHVMHGGDVFPFAANTTRKVDLDHTIPYAQGGPTAVGNLAPMTRTHHRIKTHAGWELRQPFPGILIWRDPYGAHYLIDHSGTRQLTGNTTTAGEQELTRLEIHTSKFLVNYLAA